MLQDRYERIKRIGEGSYGVVYKAIDHISQVSKKGVLTEKVTMESLVHTFEVTTIGKSHPCSENKDPNAMVLMEETKSSAAKPSFVAIKKLHVTEVKS